MASREMAARFENCAGMTIDARIAKHLPPTSDSPAFDLDIHLQAPAAITVLFGPSGSGKTLTLNCVAGFTKPDHGRILINDRLLFDHATNVHVPPQARRCGYLFQDHALFPHMSVRENLLFAARVSRTGKRGMAQRRLVNELLDAFELGELAGRRPAQLSGGQKQRAALARILVTEPEAVLLDEPARGLDARLKQSFFQVLRDMRERLNCPMLLVTHDLDECFELAEYVCLLDRGQFLQAGRRQEVLSRPSSAEAARLLGIYSIVPGEIRALDPSRDT
ncbi:MAG: ATP-binding cassette domain-containing protein, partial [Acidobacteriaceae bacterium]|nr:ATP-binding cassette domain-containing protein [Acidobacteriaceae bacterium]